MTSWVKIVGQKLLTNLTTELSRLASNVCPWRHNSDIHVQVNVYLNIPIGARQLSWMTLNAPFTPDYLHLLFENRSIRSKGITLLIQKWWWLNDVFLCTILFFQSPEAVERIMITLIVPRLTVWKSPISSWLAGCVLVMVIDVTLHMDFTLGHPQLQLSL